VLVVALVALALGAAAFVVLRMQGGSAPVAARTASPPPTLAPSATASASPVGTVTVDVAGKVRHPGVATLPAGARVVDALRKAGGARGGVDLGSLNLARVLVDGEQILVGRGAPGGGIAAGAATSAPDPAGALVNLNTADETQLDTLPGVGPVTAQKILEWRSAHGAFSSVDELLEVDGIGEKTLADLAPHVTL
jgi:competence protein ComEA